MSNKGNKNWKKLNEWLKANKNKGSNGDRSTHNSSNSGKSNAITYPIQGSIRHTELTLSNKVKLIISKELQSQIMVLHHKVGNVEWSGPLFYEIVSGDINDPSNLVLKARYIFPCDVGTHSYTEYSPDETWMDFYDKYPEAMQLKMGHLHTHHSMATFFSGTDTSELHDNAGFHNFYLSLIVNHDSKPCAKVAMVAERTIKGGATEDYLIHKGANGEDVKMELTSAEVKDRVEKVLVLIDCDIEFEQDKFFYDRIEELRKPKVHYSPNIHYGQNDYSRNLSNYYNKNENKKTNDSNKEPELFDDLNSEYHKSPVSKLDKIQILGFLVKLISCDPLCEDSLLDVIKRKQESTKGKQIDLWLNTMDDNYQEFADRVLNLGPFYLEDQHYLADRCIQILQPFEEQYSVTSDIISVLDDYIDEDIVKDEKIKLIEENSNLETKKELDEYEYWGG